MTPIQEIEAIKVRFKAGQIRINEMPGLVEPILVGASLGPRGDAPQARRIANDMELAIYTLNEPNKSNRIIQLLEESVAFLSMLPPDANTSSDVGK
jgi:hypothetical protein